MAKLIGDLYYEQLNMDIAVPELFISSYISTSEYIQSMVLQDLFYCIRWCRRFPQDTDDEIERFLFKWSGSLYRDSIREALLALI